LEWGRREKGGMKNGLKGTAGGNLFEIAKCLCTRFTGSRRGGRGPNLKMRTPFGNNLLETQGQGAKTTEKNEPELVPRGQKSVYGEKNWKNSRKMKRGALPY